MCEFCSNPKLISKLPDQIQILKIIVVFKPPGVSLGSVDSHQCLLAGKVSAKLESVMREGGGKYFWTPPGNQISESCPFGTFV